MKLEKLGNRQSLLLKNATDIVDMGRRDEKMATIVNSIREYQNSTPVPTPTTIAAHDPECPKYLNSLAEKIRELAELATTTYAGSHRTRQHIVYLPRRLHD